MRQQPDLNTTNVGTVSNGQAFKVLAQEHNWVQIQYNDKKAGWVYSFYGTFSNIEKKASNEKVCICIRVFYMYHTYVETEAMCMR